MGETTNHDSAEPARRKSWPRRIGVLFLTVAVSLAVAKAFETLSSCENVISAGKWQQGWYATVSAMAPHSLVTEYVSAAFQVADTGTFEMRPAGASDLETSPIPLRGCRIVCPGSDVPPGSRTSPVTAGPAELPARETAAQAGSQAPSEHDLLCGDLRARIHLCPDVKHGYSDCAAEMRPLQERFDAECAGWTGPTPAPEREAGDQPSGPSPDEPGSGHLGVRLAAPVAGLVMTFARLVEPGGWTWIWVALQLGVGLLFWIFVQGYLLTDPKRPGIWPQGVRGWAVGVPAGTVICASAMAFVMRLLMAEGLAVFGWFTCFAATACAVIGLAMACRYFVVKLAEEAARDSKRG